MRTGPASFAVTIALLSSAMSFIPRRAEGNELPTWLVTRIEGPGVLRPSPGGSGLAEYTFSIEPRGGRPLPDGATFLLRGWSVAVRSERIRLVSASLADGVRDAAVADGVLQVETTTGPGNEGLTCTALLPRERPLELAFGSVHPLLRIQVEVPVDRPHMALLAVDGPLEGSQGLVETWLALEDGSRLAPSYASQWKVDVLDGRPCGDVFVGFTEGEVVSPYLFDGFLGGISGESELTLPADGNESRAVTTHVALASVLCDEDRRYTGVQGWSLSLELKGDARPVAAELPEFIRKTVFSGGFQNTRLVVPSADDERQGFVNSVILGFCSGATLPPFGTAPILKVEVEAQAPSAQGSSGETEAQLLLSDGLLRDGRPVANQIMALGQSLAMKNQATAALRYRFRWGQAPFLRGDANGDGRIDISDPIFTLHRLFYGASRVGCAAAQDANGDSRGDISDGIYLFQYLFLGGAPPPPPFPECGTAPQDCETGQLLCP